ncbi:MAG: recombinase family protein [Bacteroidales bacterium]|nr:recombinase family protein [Bacteroidales bacterium]
MTESRTYVLWRRVSTKQQGDSGLGLDAQLSIAEYFMQSEPVKVFTDVYSGTKLAECPNLNRAMKYCKEHDYLLVIAKTDRFRNVKQALDVLDEMGDGNLKFCDLPTTDRTVLTIVFAVWERQATMGQINTKRGLAEAKKRGVKLGRPAVGVDKNGKPIYDVSAMVEAASQKRIDAMIKWREESQAVKFAMRKRAEGWTLQQIVDEIGQLYDDNAPKDPNGSNPYGTPTGCKPSKGTISKWLREANPLVLVG